MIQATEMSKTHEQAIDDLIPDAVKVANKAVPDWKHNGDEWDRIYFKEMNRLTIGAGLRVRLK